MGNFYVNYTIHSKDNSGVVNALNNRNAYVTQCKNDSIVVFDEASDSQDPDLIRSLGKQLSKALNTAVLAVLNHDDDILWYVLFDKGNSIDEYDSSPGYFDPDSEPQNPSGGNAEKLCAAFNCHDVQEIERVLRKSSYDEDGYTFAVERHEELAKALNLPDFSVGFGYTYIAQGELPPGLSESELTKV